MTDVIEHKAQNNDSKDVKKIALYLPVELLKQIDEYSKKSFQTRNAYVRAILEKHVSERNNK